MDADPFAFHPCPVSFCRCIGRCLSKPIEDGVFGGVAGGGGTGGRGEGVCRSGGGACGCGHGGDVGGFRVGSDVCGVSGCGMVSQYGSPVAPSRWCPLVQSGASVIQD